MPSDDARHLAANLDEDEQELWRQLRRKRDFEGRVAEKRAQLMELRDRRRESSRAHAEARVSVEHLTGELEFVEEQQREIEHDIAQLRESNRILQQQALLQQKRQHGGYGDMEAHEILAEEKRRQESVELQHEQISHLRAHIEKLRAEKANLQYRQQILFERQRSAEQDRNRLLGTLQDERSAINEVRQERIKLWEERTMMEQEMAQVVSRVVGDAPTAAGAGVPASGGQTFVPGASGGVRGRVTKDTPQAFADTTNMGSFNTAPGGMRSGWTGFGADGGGFPGGGGMPPSFGDLASAPGGGGGAPGGSGVVDDGITEWAPKMRDFRTSGGAF